MLLLLDLITFFVLLLVLRRVVSKYCSLFCAAEDCVSVNGLFLFLEDEHFAFDYRVMLQRHRPFLGVLDIYFFLLDAADPLCKFQVIRHRR